MPLTLKKIDPRYYQISALSGLVAIAIGIFHIQITPINVLAIIATAVMTQILLEVTNPEGIRGIPSALISALSLCLLLRTTDVVIAIIAALIAIGSKRLLSYRGQHLFNPTAFSLVATTYLFEGAWISPGQWGHELYLLILVVGAGSLVSQQASRLDISVGFLFSFGLLCFLRAAYLGDPANIVLHQLSNGALLIFAFFMISDPRTSPRSRQGRLIYALVVAIVCWVLSFLFYLPNGPIYALVFCAPLVPVLNKYFSAGPYQWPGHQTLKPRLRTLPGVHHA